jgi:hypothetical protein
VGRTSELGSLEEALAKAEEGPQLAVVVGPAGIGKSALARRFGDEARERGHRVRWLSGDELPANAQDLLEALAEQDARGFEGLGRGARADVLVIDAFERLGSLAHWFFDRMLPLAGARLFVLMTSRERLDARRWRELRMQLDPRELVLGALSSTESAQILAAHRVADALVAPICDSCRGHALSLSLLAERYAGGAPADLAPGLADDGVGALARDLVHKAPTPAHRTALRALAIASGLDRRALAALVSGALGASDARVDEIAEWLERSALASPGARGLAPHALVREAVFAHSVATEPAEHVAIAESIVEELLRRVSSTPVERKLQLVLEMLYARRETPFVRDGLGLDRLSQIHLRVANADDVERVAALIAEAEGERATALFRHWHALQPANLFVIVDQEDRPEGVYFMIDMDRTTPEQRACDPLAVNAARVSERVGPGVAYPRWFFARNGYQTFGPELTAVMFSGPLISGLRKNQQLVFQIPDPDRWASLAGPFRMERRPDLDCEIDGDPVGVYHRDLRPMIARAKGDVDLEFVADLLSTMGVGPAASQAVPAAPSVAPPLDEDAFAVAVRATLPLLHRRHELAASPLAYAAIVAAKPGAPPLEIADAVADTVRRVCAELRQSPAYAASARVLEVTFLEHADKQRAAAATLGLPYGTYRHQLRAAIALFVRELWAREISARKTRGG